jgi:hypothetical protein
MTEQSSYLGTQKEVNLLPTKFDSAESDSLNISAEYDGILDPEAFMAELEESESSTDRSAESSTDLSAESSTDLSAELSTETSDKDSHKVSDESNDKESSGGDGYEISIDDMDDIINIYESSQIGASNGVSKSTKSTPTKGLLKSTPPRGLLKSTTTLKGVKLLHDDRSDSYDRGVSYVNGYDYDDDDDDDTFDIRSDTSEVFDSEVEDVLDAMCDEYNQEQQIIDEIKQEKKESEDISSTNIFDMDLDVIDLDKFNMKKTVDAINMVKGILKGKYGNFALENGNELIYEDEYNKLMDILDFFQDHKKELLHKRYMQFEKMYRKRNNFLEPGTEEYARSIRPHDWFAHLRRANRGEFFWTHEQNIEIFRIIAREFAKLFGGAYEHTFPHVSDVFPHHKPRRISRSVSLPTKLSKKSSVSSPIHIDKFMQHANKDQVDMARCIKKKVGYEVKIVVVQPLRDTEICRQQISNLFFTNYFCI